MYQINPLTEEELDKLDLAEDGDYDFEVVKSEDKVSQSGNPMNKLQLHIWNEKNPKAFVVYDYLVFTNVGLNIRKVKHFCEAVGIEQEYLAGKVRTNFEGLSGRCKIVTKEGEMKNDGTSYPRKNIVLDYLKPSLAEKPLDTFEDDKDLPF